MPSDSDSSQARDDARTDEVTEPDPDIEPTETGEGGSHVTDLDADENHARALREHGEGDK
jgi:hypothetical protein